MPLGVGQPAAKDGEILIDPVGELEAAILDMDASLSVAAIAAVHIGDP
jgi:hypothetical protein